MEFTLADLEALNAAIASGAKRVRFQTHEVEYQSIQDMMKARDLIKSSLATAPANGAMFAQYESDY